jgi:metal-responsive CopG/Arc/MetJ family transcriptional regulator
MRNIEDQTIVVRVPKPLVADFKETCEKNYKTMSEAIRDLIQIYIKENKNEEKSN